MTQYLSLTTGATDTSAASSFANTTSGLSLGLVFNGNGWTSAAYTGISEIWGAFFTLPGGVTAMRGQYWPWSQSWVGGTSIPTDHDLAWLKANHPDWLMYVSNTQDDAHLAYYFYTSTVNTNPSNHPPTIDLSVTAAQQWVVDTIWKPAVVAGCTFICIDNNPSANIFSAAGHFSGGTWVPQYTGGGNVSGNYADTVWAGAQKTALSAMIDYLHATYPSVPVMLNNTYTDQTAYHTTNPSDDVVLFDNINLLPNLGALMTEGGMSQGQGIGGHEITTNTSRVTNPWLYIMTKQAGVAKTKGLFYLGKTGYTVTANMTTTGGDTTQTNGMKPSADIDWSLANFFMMKGARGAVFYLAGNGQYTQQITQITQSEYTLAATIGSAIEDFHTAAAGEYSITSGTSVTTPYNLYERKFSNGIVYVNPDANVTVSVTLPSGSWKNCRNVTQTSPITLGPASGAVLVH